MNITPEIVKNLLVSLVTPQYPELVKDYKVVSSTKGDYTSYAIGVVLDMEKYGEMETFDGRPLSGLDTKIEKDVKDVLRYVGLGPTNSTVTLF